MPHAPNGGVSRETFGVPDGLSDHEVRDMCFSDNSM